MARILIAEDEEPLRALCARALTMDGALALAAARDHPALTILLMTGYADQRERAHGLDTIIHDVISKPFSVATLRGAVTEALTVRARGKKAVLFQPSSEPA